MDYLQGTDVLGAWGTPVEISDPDWGHPIYIQAIEEDVLGAEDIAARQREMNQLRKVPVVVANVLLKYGMQAIQKAQQGARQPWYKFDLPGDAKRNEVYWKLQWHLAELGKYAMVPNEIYPSADDLKKWVMQAFIEENAVEEGAADPTWKKAWSDYAQMMAEVGRVIATLPKEIAKAVGGTIGDVVQGATGIPIWGWAIIGTGVLGALGFFVYKLANTRAASAAVGAYLGGGRR